MMDGWQQRKQRGLPSSLGLLNSSGPGIWPPFQPETKDYSSVEKRVEDKLGRDAER